MKRKMLVGMTLAVALVIPLAGCAGKMQLSAEKMCMAAGGKYSMQAQTCDQPAVNGRKVSEMCMAHGGVYDPVLQQCNFEGVK